MLIHLTILSTRSKYSLHLCQFKCSSIELQIITHKKSTSMSFMVNFLPSYITDQYICYIFPQVEVRQKYHYRFPCISADAFLDDNFLLALDGKDKKIYQIALDRSMVTTIPITGLVHPVAVDYDPINKLVCRIRRFELIPMKFAGFVSIFNVFDPNSRVIECKDNSYFCHVCTANTYLGYF